MIYKAEGDPWIYYVDPSGRPFGILGPDGKFQHIKLGSNAFVDIERQIASGRLQAVEPEEELSDLPKAPPMPDMSSGGPRSQPFDETADKATQDYAEQKIREARGYPAPTPIADAARAAVSRYMEMTPWSDSEEVQRLGELEPTPLREARARREALEANQMAADVTRSADAATADLERQAIARNRGRTQMPEDEVLWRSGDREYLLRGDQVIARDLETKKEEPAPVPAPAAPPAAEEKAVSPVLEEAFKAPPMYPSPERNDAILGAIRRNMKRLDEPQVE